MLPSSDPQGPTATLVSDALAKGVSAVAEERRESARLCKEVPMNIKNEGCADGRPCRTENISEGGFYLRAPRDHRLVVGQRCEVVFAEAGGPPELSGLAGGPFYATVVRTEPVRSESKPLLGVGLRFDQPLPL